MPEPSATPSPQPTDFADAQTLIRQIASEARASGKSLTFDPEAPPDAESDDGGDAPPKPVKPGNKPAKAAKAADEGITERETESHAEQDPEEASEQGDEDPGEAGEADDSEESAAPSGEIDVEGVRAALAAEGGVDLLALAKALGKEPEALGLTPGAAKFLRLEKRKARETLSRAEELAVRLQRDYGDQIVARKAAERGDLDPAIKFIEATFGRDWNEVNKMVVALLQGKPVKDVEEKRRLRELEADAAKRAAEDAKRAEDVKAAEKVTQAKTWIATQIKGDKLASPELAKALHEAGFPPIVDLVFEEMQAGYSKGLTDPKKALENVRAKLVRQAKALRTAGLVPAGKPAKPAPLSTGKPRADAQTGAAGNGRAMTDQELRQAVLKEAGLWR